MYKLSFKTFNKFQWFLGGLLLIGYCPVLFPRTLSMTSVLLFNPYITLVLNNLFIYYEDKKASLVLHIKSNLISRLGSKTFINKYIFGCFIEMIIFSILVYGILAVFQYQGMTEMESNLLPSVLLFNTLLYLFFTGCFCLKILINNRFLDKLLTFIPVITNVLFHYIIIQNIYEPIYNAIIL